MSSDLTNFKIKESVQSFIFIYLFVLVRCPLRFMLTIYQKSDSKKCNRKIVFLIKHGWLVQETEFLRRTLIASMYSMHIKLL